MEENSILEEKQVFKQLEGILNLLDRKPYYNNYLIRLLDLIGATILGVKPAELLNIPVNEGETKNSPWEECRAFLGLEKSIEFREIKTKNERIQVLFYHCASLDKTLRSKANLKFLRQIGYPEPYSLEVYVDFLVKRLNQGDFPHEVGIFLGYPLKDVLGFIGHPSLRLVKTQGWKIYGNEKLSVNKYQSFIQARTKVKGFIDSLHSQGIYSHLH
ncbi:DUF3793 family protein [Desulfosporosinus sp. PR]|uniref:DUF3793 family protein n=1 Tax=Candidatus Desulfosporosinus nitrosoreducens TaxID=3401928 RepID=UPI0027FBFE26|nr:DUF3793 family protein [Desulfosporosinus sp. PR]MDQ7092325.1 DUF3793 family protein [Desulfosporosinus sp. PR]